MSPEPASKDGREARRPRLRGRTDEALVGASKSLGRNLLLFTPSPWQNGKAPRTFGLSWDSTESCTWRLVTHNEASRKSSSLVTVGSTLSRVHSRATRGPSVLTISRVSSWRRQKLHQAASSRARVFAGNYILNEIAARQCRQFRVTKTNREARSAAGRLLTL